MSYYLFLEKVKALTVIDTHEHFMEQTSLAALKPDFYDMLTPYVCDILLSSGMTREQWVLLNNKSLSPLDRWNIFEPYLDNIRYTTYFNAIYRNMRDCYGMQDITLEEVIKVSENLADSNNPDSYEELKRKNNIESILTFIPYDAAEQYNSGILIPVPTVSDICIKSCNDIERLERASGTDISRFDELIAAIEIVFKKYSNIGIKAVKFGSAYRRKLNFEYASYSEAEEVFKRVVNAHVNGDSKMCGVPGQILGEKDIKHLDDYLTDYMISAAGKLRIPVFFHGGLHAWNENSVEAARTSYMEGLIRRHKNVNFIILHCGMPFIDEAVLLCRYYSNVYLNLTWSHIIDRNQTCLIIKKFIELLPVNKIHGFGGDYIYPQQIYGHQQIAYENIASVLFGYVSENYMTEEQALNIAHKWLYENPKQLLKI